MNTCIKKKKNDSQFPKQSLQNFQNVELLVSIGIGKGE